MANKGKTVNFRVHTARLLEEIVECSIPQKSGVLYVPLNQFRLLLLQVAQRAIKVNDPILNKLMFDLTLYEIPEPGTKEYGAMMDAIYKNASEQEEKEKSGQEQFPNGFDSWHETHFEISEAIGFELNKGDDDSMALRVLNRRNEQGTGGLYELARELTDKFEQQNKGKEWDGEFFDAIGDFINNEFEKEA